MPVVPNLRAGAIAILIASLAFAAFSFIRTNRINDELRAELAKVDARFEAMSVEHRQAMLAADLALKEREKIRDEQEEKMESLRNACPDLDRIPLNDELRLFFKNVCPGKVPAASEPALRY